MCVVDNLTERTPRLRRRSRRGTDRALLVRQQLAGVEGAVRGRPRHHLRRVRDRRDLAARTSKFYDFPTIPLSTKPVQNPIPFWYPGSPVTAGRHGMNLMWPGPIDQAGVRRLRRDVAQAQGRHASRLDGPNSEPRVGCTMVLAIAPTETRGARHRAPRHDRAAAAGAQRAQARPSRAAGGRVRRRPRPAAQHHGPHGRRHPRRRRHRRPDRGALRRHPRAGPDRLHRAADPDRRHDARRGEAHDGPLHAAR